MKKSVLIFVVSVLFFGCSSEQKKAERIAEKFLEAYYISFDFDKCFELSSPSSAPKIKDKKTMIGFNPLAKEQPPTIAVVKTVIDESATMAQCSYTINGAVQSLALLKLSGHWLVDAVASDLDAVSVFGGGHGGFAVGTSIPRSQLRKMAAADSVARTEAARAGAMRTEKSK